MLDAMKARGMNGAEACVLDRRLRWGFGRLWMRFIQTPVTSAVMGAQDGECVECVASTRSRHMTESEGVASMHQIWMALTGLKADAQRASRSITVHHLPGPKYPR